MDKRRTSVISISSIKSNSESRFFSKLKIGNRRASQQSLSAEDLEKLEHAQVIELREDTYQQIISNPSKDVLVDYYWPDCPYCIELAPTYDRLAAFYQNDIDKITIVKCNVSVIPIPDISYFPTIKMFPADAKDFPVEYIAEDPGDIQGYLDFIEEEGFHHLQAKEEAQKEKSG